MRKNKILLFLFTLIIICSCNQSQDKLPILGERTIIKKNINGKIFVDSAYHIIPAFTFTGQDSKAVTKKTFQNKVYVADFFFTSCPTICPVMKSQMLRIYEHFSKEKGLLLLSHTIDPAHDSVEVLKDYAERLGVDTKRWHFVTGAKDSIYSIAREYMVSALEDKNAPGGFVHSGALILVDKHGHVRGYYDGTDEKKVDQLIKDIPIVLNEK